MRNILKIFTFAKGFPLFCLYLVFCFWMLGLRSHQQKLFHDVAISTLLAPVQKIINTVTHYSNIKSENVRLRQENARLKWLYDQREQAAIENRRLRNFFKFYHTPEYPIQLAQVIARDPSRLNSSLVIGIGEGDSLKPGMPVYTPTGTVGKIAKVYANHSTVQLLKDLSSRVSVMENRSRTIGILESKNGVTVTMSFPSHAEVFTGDTIVTSGLGGIYPKGLSVGRVESIEPDEVKVLSLANIQLFQNPRYIEEVFVMKKEPSQILQKLEVSENE